MPAVTLLFGSGRLTSDGVGGEEESVNGVEKTGVVEGAGAGGSKEGSERMECVFVKLRPGAEGRERGPRASNKRRRHRVQSMMKYFCSNGRVEHGCLGGRVRKQFGSGTRFANCSIKFSVYQISKCQIQIL